MKIEELLARQGVRVPYRTLHRFAVERCGFRLKTTTVRGVDGEPGVEVRSTSPRWGFILDGETGKKRRVHALIFTAVVSRHMFVWLTYSQRLAAVIAGCETACEFYGGCFKVLIPDNVKAVVTNADAVNPQLSKGWLGTTQGALHDKNTRRRGVIFRAFVKYAVSASPTSRGSGRRSSRRPLPRTAICPERQSMSASSEPACPATSNPSRATFAERNPRRATNTKRWRSRGSRPGW